jgi:hypothetical protein
MDSQRKIPGTETNDMQELLCQSSIERMRQPDACFL